MQMKAVFFLIMTAGLSAAQAQDADLTLPPELRENKAAPLTKEHPVGASKAKAPSAKSKSKSDSPLAHEISAPAVAAPRKKEEENPISLGASWNANNTSEGSTRATSGLTETNKNHDGESAGIGAKLGLGYKF